MAKISYILGAFFLFSGMLTACGSKNSQSQEALQLDTANGISGGIEAPTNSTDPAYWAVAQLKRKTVWRKVEAVSGGTMTSTSIATIDCTAALVEQNILVTAAHCLAPETRTGPDGYTFVSSDLFAEFTQKVTFSIRVNAEVQYPGFKMDKADQSTYLKNDIAVLKLETPAPAPLKPVALFNKTLIEGQQLNIRRYGYGLTNMVNDVAFAPEEQKPDQSKHEDILRQIDGAGTIQKSRKLIFYDAKKLDAGTCPGDSGGPNFTYVDGQAYLVGVNSSYSFSGKTKDLCRDENYSVLVPEYLSWLQDNITKLKSPRP